MKELKPCPFCGCELHAQWDSGVNLGERTIMYQILDSFVGHKHLQLDGYVPIDQKAPFYASEEEAQSVYGYLEATGQTSGLSIFRVKVVAGRELYDFVK